MKKIVKILTIISILLVISNCREGKGKLILINKSSKNIENISVKLSGESNKIPILKIAEESRLLFNKLSDSHYIISGKYVGGENFKYEFGYVTSGMKFTDSLIFLDSSKYDYRFHLEK